MSLLGEIQTAALDSRVDLADLLRKCKVLAARLKHQQFADWVSRELNGYAEESEIPSYRRIKTQSFGHFVGPYGRRLNNAPIASLSMPDELKNQVNELTCRQSVSALQELLKGNAEQDLQSKWAADLIVYCQHHVPMYSDMTLLSAWRTVGRADIRTILDTVRTRVLDFVLAIEAESPEAGDVPAGKSPPVPPERTSVIYNTTILNGQAIVGTSGGNVNLSTGALRFSPAVKAEHYDHIERELAHIRECLKGLDASDRTVATEALAKVEAELAATTPSPSSIERYLGLLANLATVAAPSAEALKMFLVRILAG
jgi:hypothetical protein